VREGSGERRKEKSQMNLQINVPVSGFDLASLLQGEEGFFLCQNRGQNALKGASLCSQNRKTKPERHL
jgi:hypothetical protein